MDGELLKRKADSPTRPGLLWGKCGETWLSMRGEYRDPILTLPLARKYSD